MKPITKQLTIAAFILSFVTVLSFGIRYVHIVDAESDPQHANASDSDENAPWDDHAEAKSFKGDDAKSKGSKSLQKISLGYYENLYLTKEG